MSTETFIMQKVAEVAPRHYAFLIKTAAEIKASPFKDEIVKELDGLTKHAMNWQGFKSGMGTAGRSMGGHMASFGGAVGTAAAGGIALALAGDMYAAAKRGITKTRNYQNMMAANPNLADLPAHNVQSAFSVLHHLNPEFAGDPNIAGAWVGRQAIFGDDNLGDTKMLSELVSSRKSLSDSHKLPGFQVHDLRGPERTKQQLSHGVADESRRGEKHEWDRSEQPAKKEQHSWQGNEEGRRAEKHQKDESHRGVREEMDLNKLEQIMAQLKTSPSGYPPKP